MPSPPELVTLCPTYPRSARLPCGRESASTDQVDPTLAGVDLDERAGDALHELTGDDHPCGESDNSLYEVTIIDAPDRPELVGRRWE